MSDKNLKLTYEQLAYIVEQTGILDPKSAMEYFASLMKMEGISPRHMPQVVFKLMERQKKGIK